MAILSLEEFNKQFESPTKTPSTFTPSGNVQGIPQEVIDFTNDQNNIRDHITDAEPTTSQKVMGYGGGAAVEMGLGFGSTYALSKNATYAKHLNKVVSTVKTIKNTGRGVAAVGAGAAAAEPISTAGSLLFLGVTEAAAWGLSNYAGQQIRVASGVQDAVHGSEVIAASLFGIVARPVEGLQMFDDMGRAINAKLPVKFEESGLIATKAWKGREVLVKGTPRFVSGSALGLAESAFRQELAIQMGDIENREVYDYLFSAGFGGTFNSIFSVYNGTGAWGRKQATDLSDRAANRLKEAIETIDDQLQTATRHKKKFLLAKRRERQTALDLIEDFKAKVDEQAANIDNNANQEIKQPLPEIVKEKQAAAPPKKEPTNADLTYKELQAKAKKAGIKANQKKQDLVDQLDAQETQKAPEQALSLEDANTRIDELEKEYRTIKEDKNYEMYRPEITRKGRKIYDAAEYDTINAIERLNVDADDMEALDLLLQASEIKLRLKDGVLGELNNSSGLGVQKNKKNSKPTTPTKYSIATETEIDSLNQLIGVLKKRKAIKTGDLKDVVDTTFVDKANALIDAPKEVKKGQRAKARAQASDATKKKITSLEKQLEKLRKRFADDEAVQAKDKETEAESPEVIELKEKIAAYKRFEKEALDLDKNEKELERLIDILGSGDEAKIRTEVKNEDLRKGTKTIKGRVDKLKEQISTTKKTMRKLVDDLDEAQAPPNQDKEELYRAIYDSAYAEAHSNQSAALKIANGVRTARKLAMVNSITSAQAAVPTGAFEMARLIFKPIGTLVVESFRKGYKIGDRMAQQEMYGSVQAYSFLWNKKNREQLFKHIKTTFKEGADPNYRSSTKFSDDFQQQRAFTYGTEREIIRKAKLDARAQVEAEGQLVNWARNSVLAGKFVDFMSLGARAIMATDAGFKRQLRIAAATTKARQKAILAYPDDIEAYEKYANELYNSWTKDRNGLEVLDGEEALNAEFADIDGALLMASTVDDVGQLEKGFFEQFLVDPFDKLMRSDMNRVQAATLEAIMPFYKIGVRSVARGMRFTTLGVSKNPYKRTIQTVKSEIEVQETAMKQAFKKGDKKAAERKAAIIKNQKERLEILEARELNFKKEQVTDAVVGATLYSSGILMGLRGQLTGTNAWMTDEQKRNNPNIKSFKMFGADYRSGVPFNFPLAIGADIGNYLRMREEQQRTGKRTLVDNKNLLTVVADSTWNTFQELPLFEGLRQINLVTDADDADRLKNIQQVTEKLIYSYVPVPSQAKKITRHFSAGGKMSDLRGGSFYERAVYNVFGISPQSRKLNALGEEIESTRGVEFTYNRFAVEKTIEPSRFDLAKQADHYNQLPDLPRNFEGMDMNDFRDEDGYTLKMRWAETLRTVEIDGKTIKEAVNDYLTGDMTEYKGESVDYFEISNLNRPNPDGTYDNKGLLVLGSIIRKYYRETNKQILENDDFLFRFINAEDENLLRIVEGMKDREQDNDGFVEGKGFQPIEPYFKK